MSIQVSKTIPQLKQIAGQLGVTYSATGKNGRLMKEDLILPIREANLIKRYGGLEHTPDSMRYMLSIKSPMLAKRIDSLREEQQAEIWDNEDWIFEEKLDGVRCIVIKDNTGFHIFSRHSSEVDFLPIEFTSKILMPDDFNIAAVTDNFVIDCEITSDLSNISTVVGRYGVETETELSAVTAILQADPFKAHLIQNREQLRFTFNCFDVLMYNGTDMKGLPLSERRDALSTIMSQLRASHMKVREVRSVRGSRADKESFYNSLVRNGGEGCVCKRASGLYVADSSRTINGWVKIKRSLSSSLNEETQYGDTIDGWISGFVPGNPGTAFEDYVGSIIVSAYVEMNNGTVQEREIAIISGITLAMRKDMTHIVNGQVELNPKYYNAVVEIDGQDISSKNMRFTHALLLRMRPDKNKDSCTITEKFLESQIF